MSAARYGPPAKASADVVAALLMTRLCISLILGIEYLARILHLSAIATVLPTVRLNLMWSEQLLCRNFRMMAGAFGLPLRQSQPQWRKRPGRAQTYPQPVGAAPVNAVISITPSARYSTQRQVIASSSGLTQQAHYRSNH